MLGGRSPTRVLVTGRPGVGKTTLVLRVVELLGRPVRGFVTEEWREAGRRMGFRLRTFSGEETVLARRGRRGRPRVGRYGVDVEALERVGVRELRRALGEDVLVVIDEVGKMELLSQSFRETVAELFRGPRDILATVTRSPLPLARELLGRSDVRVIELRPELRERLPERLAAEFRAGGKDPSPPGGGEHP